MLFAIRFVLPLTLMMMAATAAGLTQQYRGHLRGTITDPEGNPAPGAAMRITSESSGESRRFVAGPDGYYTVADLLPGTYRISSEDDRYRTFGMRTVVSIGHDAHLDLPLGLSPITMTADVRPTHIPFDRFSPALTTRLPLEFVQRLPLESRDYLDAASLAPGIIRGGGGIAAAGTSAAFTGYVVDGLGWSRGLTDTPPTQLPLDAISHLHVLSSSYDASYGRFAGAQISIATRSGTNTPHGGAHGFLQPDGERAIFGGYGGGPIARDRTFAFGSYQFSTVDGREGDGHLLSGRADHLFNDSSRLTGRASADTTAADGHAQAVGVSLHTVGSSAWTNEARFGVVGESESDDDARALQLANVASYVHRRHLLRGGVSLSTHSREVGTFEASATTFGLFVQDDWWLRPDLTVSAGARYDRYSPDSVNEASNHVSPRLGVSWVADREARTLVRAGYGLAFNHVHLDDSAPSLDMWSVAVRRWLGRARALEAAYLGPRGDDTVGGRGSSSYDALQVTFEERSEANMAAFMTYTYGNWSQELPFDPDARAALDARHRMTASFVASLPFGEDRRWFDDGFAADILGNMQLTGIFRLRSGLPVAGRPGDVGESLRNLDAALVKTIWLGLTRTLELRVETYNLTNNEASRDRRYQLGGRFKF